MVVILSIHVSYVSGTAEQEISNGRRKTGLQENLEPGSKNILYKSLVNSKKILLLTLHIKLMYMKQFVKPLPKEGNCFMYLLTKFPHLSEEGNFSTRGKATDKSNNFMSKRKGIMRLPTK